MARLNSIKASDEVVYFGSGPVSAKALELLIKHTSVEAVITKPKPAHHRGEFPVIEVAKKHSLPILYASNKTELSDLFSVSNFSSKIAILIDFGIIVDQDVIDYFPKGIVNSHFSILPEWRGADPITFAILSGQEVTGVSLMLLVKKMDEGPLIAYGTHPIQANTTNIQLTADLINLSDELLKKNIPSYRLGKLHPFTQSKTLKDTSYSRKITKADGVINYSKSAEEIHREIRAYQGWPKSKTTLLGKDLVVIDASVVVANGKEGELRKGTKDLVVYCRSNALKLSTVIPAGKRKMSGQAFLDGARQ